MLVKHTFLSATFYALVLCSNIHAQDISIIGSWSESIGASDLQSGAGSDLVATYESAPNQIECTISNSGIDSWRVDVKKVDSNWHADTHLHVKRTSDGTGSGSISGGITYQEVTGVDQSFFSGGQDRQEIYIQLKLDGISVQIEPNAYSTTVYYTVVNTG